MHGNIYTSFYRLLKLSGLLDVVSRHFSSQELIDSVGGISTTELMAKSRLPDETEPAVFLPEVAKQHDIFAGAIAFGVLVNARVSIWLDKKIVKLLEFFKKIFQNRYLFPRLGYS